jgi:ABC-type microcin C transport system duplicated ATPase subunit YejF
MLDVSLRAGVLALLARLRTERGLSLLYITHDLLSARLVTDELFVRNQGTVVEQGLTKGRPAVPDGRIHREAPGRGGHAACRRVRGLTLGLNSR